MITMNIHVTERSVECMLNEPTDDVILKLKFMCNKLYFHHNVLKKD